MPLAAVDSFTPVRNEPPDFDAFWDRSRESLLEVEPKPTLARQQAPAAGLTYDLLSFDSLGQIRISGYLLSHDDAEPRPLVVHGHGYNSQYDVMLNWANAGCNVLGIDFRGFGRSAGLPLSRAGYVLTGIESPVTSVLRGAVCDLVQAMRTGRLLLGQRVSRLACYGFSFGGAMALMATAVDPVVDVVIAGQPTLGWHAERLRLSTAGSSAEINRYLEASLETREQVFATLAWFDTMHFAARIRTPAFIGIGLDDAVVPSRSVIAISNHVATGELEVRILPVSHSDDPRESLWNEFDAEWLAFLRDGLPADFGSESRQVLSIDGERPAVLAS